MDKGAKITGLLVFVAGVAMLIGVFVAALNMLNESRAMEITDLAAQLPREGFVLLARILFLFVLGFVASSVAARGIQMFESCRPEKARPTDPAPAPREEPPAEDA